MEFALRGRSSKATAMKEGATRRFWVATHRYVGLCSLTFLGLAAITGVILCFRGPIDRGLNPDLFRLAVPSARVDPLFVDGILARTHPELRVVGFPLRPRKGEALAVQVAAARPPAKLGYDQVFLDPQGRIQGVRRTRAGWDRRHLMQGIYLLHYTLLAGDLGRWFMGAVAIAWLISNFVGLYLTFPKRAPFLRQWLRSWRFKPTRSLPRLLLDLHRLGGLWALIGLCLLAYTSVGMNFFDEAFTPVVERLWPPRPSPFDRPVVAAAGPRIGFDRAVVIAGGEARRRLGLVPANVAYDAERGFYGVMLTRSGAVSYRGLGPVYLDVDAGDGHIVFEDNPYTDSLARQLSRSLFPLHSGQVAGGLGVAVVLLLGLTTLGECITGAYVWWKRRPGRVAARAPR
jgi:uncharacterized iron-regulated membrane protein